MRKLATVIMIMLNTVFSMSLLAQNDSIIWIVDADKVQNEVKEASQIEEIFIKVDEPAEFPGGLSALMKWLSLNVEYPEIAKKNKIEGKVIIQFIVEKDGSIGDAKILNSVDPYLDAEAIRVIKLLPNWKPGSNNGIPVRSYFNLPISFKLNSDNNEKEDKTARGVINKDNEEVITLKEIYDFDEAKRIESLADTELTKGNFNNATDLFIESFEINPTNYNVIEKVENLLKQQPELLTEFYLFIFDKLRSENYSHNSLPKELKLQTFIAPAKFILEKIVELNPNNKEYKKLLFYSYAALSLQKEIIPLANELYKYLKDEKVFSYDEIPYFLSVYSVSLGMEEKYQDIIDIIFPYESYLLEYPNKDEVSVIILSYSYALNKTGEKEKYKMIEKWLKENNFN